MSPHHYAIGYLNSPTNLFLQNSKSSEMGLQGQLNDVASDSIPLYLVALLAVFFNHLRSLLLPARPRFGSTDSLLGTGLAGLVVLSEQLSLNRVLSYAYSASSESAVPVRFSGPDCVFCLSGLKDGDRVRKLSCCHVFHKDCLDRWLDQMKFSCPLCRSSVVSHDRVPVTSTRLGRQLVDWFAVR